MKCNRCRAIPYEHSYRMDYGAKAGAYVDAFMQNINWDNIARFHKECLT